MKNAVNQKMNLKMIAASALVVFAGTFAEMNTAEAGWKCCKINRHSFDVSRHGIKKAAKKLEQHTRRLRKTYGDIQTFGYTRYQRKKGEAMAKEAYARAQAEAWEEKRFMEMNRLFEKQSYMNEVIGQQKAYIADADRALGFQNFLTLTLQKEISNRTMLREIEIQLSSLVSDQDQALEVLSEAIEFNRMAIDGTNRSAEAMNELRLSHAVAPAVQAGGAVSDTTVVADAVTVSWDSSLLTLSRLAKSRNLKLSQYITEIIQQGEKSELQTLVGIVVNVKTTLNSLKLRIQKDIDTNQTYADALIFKLKNTYGVAEPTPEQMEKVAKERVDEEKKMIEEMMKERQEAIDAKRAEEERIAQAQIAAEYTRWVFTEGILYDRAVKQATSEAEKVAAMESLQARDAALKAAIEKGGEVAEKALAAAKKEQEIRAQKLKPTVTKLSRFFRVNHTGVACNPERTKCIEMATGKVHVRN